MPARKVRRPRVKHKGSRRPEYSVWCGMIQRCHNPKSTSYSNYGGRGIEVCSRWRLSFEDFLEDCGPRPSKAHSLDRIDNDEGYYPGNVRWATAKEQAQNKRRNPKVEYDGQCLYLSEWAVITGVKADVLYGRIFVAQWDLPRALGTGPRW